MFYILSCSWKESCFVYSSNYRTKLVRDVNKVGDFFVRDGLFDGEISDLEKIGNNAD